MFLKKNRNKLIKDRLIKWYRERARIKFEERIQKYKTQIGRAPVLVRVRDQKTRWGSCSSKGNINLNWRLIMAPLSVIDYIVIHELAHLKHPNHSKNFWNLVGTVMPNYREKEEWLRINANLMRI